MKLDVLAIGAHPDDVELACGGTLALAARQGRKVGILHLTRGERGSRGTPEERLAEAEKAAAALGVAELAFLDFGDGGLRRGAAEEDELIEVLRTWRPELVLGPPARERHPDHWRAHELVAAASFYSGLAARTGRGGPGEHRPHRPAAVYSYMQHHSFEPTFVVDVAAAWDAKLEALAAYRSQLHPLPGGRPAAAGSAPDAAPADEAPAIGGGAITKISTLEFRLAVEGRARHFGALIGASLGEPFWSPLPLAVSDLMALLPGGIR